MKKIVYILLIILVIFIVAIFMGVTPKKDIALEINEEVHTSDLVNIKWFNKVIDEVVDTSETGKHIEIINYEKLFGKGSKEVEVEIYDDVAPTFDDLKVVSIVEGDSLDALLIPLNVYDNSEGKIDISLEGDLDLNRPFMYKNQTIVLKDTSGNTSSLTCDIVVEIKGGEATYFKTTNGNYGYTKDGMTFVDGILIVNKTYSMTPDYYNDLSEEFMENYYQMKEAMEKEGLNIWIQSGHRTHSYQEALYNGSVGRNGKALADIKTARPGHSEHEAGLASDFNYVEQYFKDTKEYAWLNDNCYKYGFVLRYVEGKEEETGYEYEPWHYRYVGKELAEILYNNGDWLTIEGYFALESKYID